MSVGVEDINIPAPSSWQRRRRVRLNGLIGLALVAATVLVATFAPWIAPYNPNASDLSALMSPPSLSSGHLLGTDDLGRDLLSRTIYGARPVILVAGTASVLAVLLGAVLGIAAGFSGRWTDQVIGRIADIQFSIPGLILALLALALFGTSIVNLVAVLALESWPLHYRIARAYTQNARTQGYMEAAWLAGVSSWRSIWRHIVPGLLPLLVTTGTISAAFIVMTEAGLSFIGLGIQPPTADWGLMIAQGKAQLGAAWWLSIVPAIALVALLAGVQLLGDYLSERLSLFEGDRL
jgi:peptide/nickel transport system permease protein